MLCFIHGKYGAIISIIVCLLKAVGGLHPSNPPPLPLPSNTKTMHRPSPPRHEHGQKHPLDRRGTCSSFSPAPPPKKRAYVTSPRGTNNNDVFFLLRGLEEGLKGDEREKDARKEGCKRCQARGTHIKKMHYIEFK